MLVDVETFLLYTFINAKTVNIFDAIEQNESTSGCPEVDDQDTEALCSEESPAVTVESTIAGREQTCHQGSQNTTDTMHRACTHGIVDMQHVVDELNGKYQYQTADQADDHSSEGRHEVTASGDTHETSQHTVQRQ